MEALTTNRIGNWPFTIRQALLTEPIARGRYRLHLSPQVADWRDVKGDQGNDEDPDECRSGHLQRSIIQVFVLFRVRCAVTRGWADPEVVTSQEIAARAHR